MTSERLGIRVDTFFGSYRLPTVGSYCPADYLPGGVYNCGLPHQDIDGVSLLDEKGKKALNKLYDDLDKKHEESIKNRVNLQQKS